LELMIVVSIIGLMASIGIPGMLRARSQTQQTTCIDNLRLLDGAKQQWALENKQSSAATPTAVQIQPYCGRAGPGKLPLCPSDIAQSFATSYVLNDCSTAPVCVSVATHVLPQ
jgi:type II secretory pathway pseudopilin PulG